MNIIITMPDLEHEGSEKLIDFYRKLGGLIYFRVPFLPKRIQAGERCAIVSNGVLIGSHEIVDIKFVSREESSELSHGDWEEGFYVIRDSMTFKEADEKIEIKGFRGFRYFDTLLSKSGDKNA